MAITVNIPEPIVSTQDNELAIIDSSVYTSPIRTAVGVFINIYKVAIDGTRTSLNAVGSPAWPADSIAWTADFTTDGWHQIYYIAVTDYAGGTTYDQYDAAYDPSSNLVYRSKSDGNIGNALSNTTYWELIPVPTDLCNNIGTAKESVNATAAILDNILYPLTKINFARQTSDSFLEASSTYRRTQDVRLSELLGIAVAAIEIAKDRQEYSNGEIFCRRAISLVPNG